MTGRKRTTKRAATQRPARPVEPEQTESKAKLRTDRNGNPKRDRRERFN